jgi:penicillin V acylase-like amidase (Ntn superfamily)
MDYVKGVKVLHRGKANVVITNEPALDWQLKNHGRYRCLGGSESLSESLSGDRDPASRFVRT